MSAFQAFEVLRAIRDMPERPGLVAADKHVLIAIVLRADSKGTCYPSHAKIAADTWLSRRSVIRSVQRLVAAGLLAVEHRTHVEDGTNEKTSNLYRVLVEVVSIGHHLVSGGHHVVTNGHVGSDSVSPGVVPIGHGGSVQLAHEVPIEVPNVRPQGSKSLPGLTTEPPSKPTVEVFSLTGEIEKTARRAKPEKTPDMSPEELAAALARVKADALSRKRKHTPEQNAGKTAIVDAFIENFEAKKGVKPDMSHKGEHAAAFKLLSRFGTDEACEIVRRAFNDDFVVRSKPQLRYIEPNANTWRGVAVAAKSNGKPIRNPVQDQGEEPAYASVVSKGGAR